MAKRLYVGNLKFTVTSAQLQELFAQYGTVSSAQVLSDRETGRSRGFGFVEMTNDEEALGAIESLDGQEYDGRRLTVNEARPRTPGGGGGGYRGGGGGMAAAAAVMAAVAAMAATTEGVPGPRWNQTVSRNEASCCTGSNGFSTKKFDPISVPTGETSSWWASTLITSSRFASPALARAVPPRS